MYADESLMKLIISCSRNGKADWPFCDQVYIKIICFGDCSGMEISNMPELHDNTTKLILYKLKKAVTNLFEPHVTY